MDTAAFFLFWSYSGNLIKQASFQQRKQLS